MKKFILTTIAAALVSLTAIADTGITVYYPGDIQYIENEPINTGDKVGSINTQTGAVEIVSNGNTINIDSSTAGEIDLSVNGITANNDGAITNITIYDSSSDVDTVISADNGNLVVGTNTVLTDADIPSTFVENINGKDGSVTITNENGTISIDNSTDGKIKLSATGITVTSGKISKISMTKDITSDANNLKYNNKALAYADSVTNTTVNGGFGALTLTGAGDIQVTPASGVGSAGTITVSNDFVKSLSDRGIAIETNNGVQRVSTINIKGKTLSSNGTDLTWGNDTVALASNISTTKVNGIEGNVSITNGPGITVDTDLANSKITISADSNPFNPVLYTKDFSDVTSNFVITNTYNEQYFTANSGTAGTKTLSLPAISQEEIVTGKLVLWLTEDYNNNRKFDISKGSNTVGFPPGGDGVTPWLDGTSGVYLWKFEFDVLPGQTKWYFSKVTAYNITQ